MIDNEETQRSNLQTEIKQLKEQIQNTRDVIYRYYTLKRKTEIMELSKSEIPQPTLPDVDLDIHFYKNILDVKPDNEDGFSVSFPFKGKTKHGLQVIIEQDKFSVKKMYLPPSINIEEANKNKIDFNSFRQYIRELQENIYAFYIREEHVNKLKEIMSSDIMISHSHTLTQIELMFKLFNTKTNIRKSLTLQINYDLYSVQPKDVNCKINFDDPDDELELLNKHFQIMTTKDLVSGYETAFKDFDEYKFFV